MITENTENSAQGLDKSVTLVHTYYSVDPMNINNDSPRNYRHLEHIEKAIPNTRHSSSVNERDKLYEEPTETNPAMYVNHAPCPLSRPTITEFTQPSPLSLTHHYFSAGDLP